MIGCQVDIRLWNGGKAWTGGGQLIDMKHYSAKRKAAVLPEDAAEALYHWRKASEGRGRNALDEQEGRKGWSAESKLTAVLKMTLLSAVRGVETYCREKGLKDVAAYISSS